MLLTVEAIPKTQNLSISLTLPFECSAEYISMMRSYTPCAVPLSAHAEESAYAFAFFMLLKEKMTMGAADSNKYRLDHIACNGHGRHFVISWNTQGTGSSLKRTIVAAFRFAKPNSIFKSYSYCIKLLGGRADRSVFDALAARMIDALGKAQVFAIGKLTASATTAEFKKGVLDAALAKLDHGVAAASKAVPEKRESLPAPLYKITCSDGAAAILVADYLQLAKVIVHVVDRDVLVQSANFETQKNKLKEASRIEAYFNSKFAKQGELATSLLAYYANSNAMGTGGSIGKLMKADVVKTIKSSLA